MTVGNDVRTLRADAPAGAEPLPGDGQALVHNDLTAVMTRGADAAMYRAKRSGGGVRLAR